MAAVDEFGQEVILVGGLEVDGLVPGGIAQPWALRFAVLHETLQSVARQAREEAVPLGAVEVSGLAAEALDGTARQPQHVAVIFPGVSGEQAPGTLFIR